MPVTSLCRYTNRSHIRREAERQVKAKFPHLMQGSFGWHRAVENRMRRLG